jgi:1-phosphofructokinase
MIYTLTMNPSVDYKIKIDGIKLNQLNRFEAKSFVAGGKGINCSIILSNLGVENKAISFLGGFTGLFIEKELHQKHIELITIPIDEETRMNVKIKTTSEETELNHIGPKIEENDFQNLINIIAKFNPNDILIVGGSSLDSIPNAYLRIAEMCDRLNVSFVMDTPGKYIKEYIKHRPILMKPNLLELEEHFEAKIHSLDDIISYGKEMIYQGAMNLIISLGHAGSIFINKDFVYQALPIDGNIISTTGAGDSMVAGFIYQYGLDQNVLHAYKMAVAASLATVFEQTLATKENTLKYLNHVLIKEILC